MKCVVVGDEGVGKTCLLISYQTNTFAKTFLPTVSEPFSSTINVFGKDVNMRF